ncbi:hypothetical protein CLAVI_000432 [Candidatus Clavichlamydia salmonicola]|uniref:hypothetical protein n=1 Tax=Candidatus Clavichlamydia salmonicola TaxID=469812 RepID=UPI001891AD6C|nr:hypothetical protein [Candidatus Clavichlamydia salmonicola]MBF5050813.1 hypothetical protein [Candidatus Clavichlamydia salmonicola]
MFISSPTNKFYQKSLFKDGLSLNLGRGTFLEAKQANLPLDLTNPTPFLDKAGGTASASISKRTELGTIKNNKLQFKDALQATTAIHFTQSSISVQILGMVVCCMNLAQGVPSSIQTDSE